MSDTTRAVLGLAALASGCFALPVFAQDAPYAPADVPTEYAVISVSAPGSVRMGTSGELLLQFSSGGAGTMIENEPNATPSMTWAVQGDGRLLVLPNSATVRTGIAYSETCPGVVFGSSTVIDRVLVRRLSKSASADQLDVDTQYTTRYVDRDPGDGCAAPTPRSETVTARKIGFRSGSQQAITAGDIHGVVALQHRLGPIRPEWSAAQWSTALFDMRSGVIRLGQGIASSFTHSLVGGRLRIGANDLTGSPVAYEYRRLQRDVRGGDGLFSVATLADGRQAVAYDYAPQQSKVALPIEVQALWFTAFSETSTDPNVAYTVEFTSKPSGSGPGLGSRGVSQRDPVTGQWSRSATPFSWSMPSGGEILIQTFRTAAGQVTATCPSGTSCTVVSARRLVVLSRFSDDKGIRKPSYVRINLLETLQLDADGDGDLEIIDQRPNFYQRNLGGPEES